MIKAIILLENHAVRQVEITGHAGYADNGYDIVCAAVSSQIISIENSLDQIVNIPVKTSVNEVDGGYLKLEIPTVDSKKQNEQAQLLLQHLVFALEVIADSYPEFVKIQKKNFIP